ncbi:hypothetical protein DZF91_31160, partial [Actinomadura logoneensis]
MLLAGLFGLVTTVASALPGGAAGVPGSSATASGLPGQDCASHCARRAAQERAAQDRAAQRSEALKAG